MWPLSPLPVAVQLSLYFSVHLCAMYILSHIFIVLIKVTYKTGQVEDKWTVQHTASWNDLIPSGKLTEAWKIAIEIVDLITYETWWFSILMWLRLPEGKSGFQRCLGFPRDFFHAGMTWITPRWNEEHPKERIRPGDSIVKVGHSWGSWGSGSQGQLVMNLPEIPLSSLISGTIHKSKLFVGFPSLPAFWCIYLCIISWNVICIYIHTHIIIWLCR